MALNSGCRPRMEQRKNKNADDTKQITDVMNNGALVCSTYVASGNEVERSLSLPCRCELLNINNEEMKKFKKGRHEAERKRYEVEQKKTEGACGYPSVPILLVSAVDNWKG
ncbi:hypothetical protein T11_4058 [Trichinella zimbabwensis]|uniref:Uncharacterized protein n=1 Tax=Trichinella zimbabwensis TaxID=268475 RepID=A0A0V1HAS7_9BILA|nr:hypothetical protein T11_4058 [Trichinella zimbabwensis]